MKELEKTKRISISAVLFLLVILIAILTYRKPKYVFEKNSKTTLEEIVSKDYILNTDSLNALDASSYALIDIRSNFEYNAGHFKDAINIATTQLLEDGSLIFFKDLKNNNKAAVLYGKNVDEANSAWMLLYQLGFDNTKILSVETSFTDDKFQAKNYVVEKPAVNYAEVMLLAKAKKGEVKEEAKPKEAPKKVIPVQKKKKSTPEGGC